MNKDRSTIGYGLALLLLLLAPVVIYPVLLVKVLCFALFACAYNLLLGYTGLLSFGHAVFFGGAAYVAGYALKEWQLPVLLSLALGAGGAAILGWLIGALSIRRQGIYFAMVTLALAQLMFFVFQQAPFTGGDDGLQGVPRGSLLGIDLTNDGNLYYLVLTIFVAAFWLIRRAINSPFGQVLKAIRENEARVISLGYDVNHYKLLAFVLSAALAGLAGATKTLVFNFASLSDAHWQMSGEVVLMTLLGGMGTVLGPVIGAALVVVLQNELSDKVGSLINVIMGSIFVFCVLLFRRGIVGESIALYRRMIGEKTR
jgi:branched-chain amino acid transport system permease protein